MTERFYFAAAALLWALLLALPLVSAWWLLLSVPWLANGYHWTAISRSRGLAADLAFMVWWPFHLAMEW